MTAMSWVVSVALLVLVETGSVQSATGANADPTKVQITLLYDAFGQNSAMQKDWGYAALVEYGGKRILFDAGNNPDILAQNAKAKGIDLAKLDFVVMSHRHGDHMGGLSYVLRVNPRVPIYAPKEGFGVYGANLPSTFYRKDPSLPQEQRYYNGAPPEVMRFGSAWPGANFQLVDQNTEIASNIHLVTLVSDKPGTLELRELPWSSIPPKDWSSWLAVPILASTKSLKLQLRSIPAFTSSLAAFILSSHPIPTSRGSSPRCMIGSKSNTLPPVTAPESQRSQP
jgi:7,8-dihydropterin-6-yl-methyl-4-(beta-D-ribofuranosyl)aminobenzene 5'-phosphate synthase